MPLMFKDREGLDDSGLNRFMLPLLFIAAGAALRFFRLGEQSLWNDEMFSFDVAGTDLSSIQTKLITSYHHPPLYFYVLHASLALFGQNAWALRFPSAVFGSLTVGLVYLTGTRLFDKWSGILSAAVCLVAPFHLAYSQEGRPYALAAFLCLLSFYFLMLSIRERGLAWFVGHFLTSLALLYTHHWGIFVLAAQAGFILLFADQGVQKQFVILFAALALLYLPEALVLRAQAASIPPSGWFWVEHPGPAEIYHLSQAFTGTYFKMASSIFDSPPVVKLAGAAALLFLFARITFASIRKNGLTHLRGVFVCSMTALLIPFVISLVRPEIFLWYRYTVIVFPLSCLLIGGILSCTNVRWLSLTAIAIIILIGSCNSARYYSWSKSNARDIAGYVETVTRSEPVQFVIRPQSFAPLFNYYYRGDIAQYDETYLDKPLGDLVDTASAFAYISIDIPSTIRSYMDGHFDKTSERIFPGDAHMGMRVGVYRQKPEEE